MSIHGMALLPIGNDDDDDNDDDDESTITRLGNWKQPNRPEETTIAAFDKKGKQLHLSRIRSNHIFDVGMDK
jgi:hypothetical protein